MSEPLVEKSCGCPYHNGSGIRHLPTCRWPGVQWLPEPACGHGFGWTAEGACRHPSHARFPHLTWPRMFLWHALFDGTRLCRCWHSIAAASARAALSVPAVPVDGADALSAADIEAAHRALTYQLDGEWGPGPFDDDDEPPQPIEAIRRAAQRPRSAPSPGPLNKEETGDE